MPSSQEVDIGVLGAGGRQQQDGSNDTADGVNNENNDDDPEAEEEPSTRWDIFNALNNAKILGSCCASDKADGTTTTPALPALPGLKINGIGNIPLPISDGHANAIKANARKIKDKSYKKVYEVDPGKVQIQNPMWKKSVDELLLTVAYKLGIDPRQLTRQLDMLLYVIISVFGFIVLFSYTLNSSNLDCAF